MVEGDGPRDGATEGVPADPRVVDAEPREHVDDVLGQVVQRDGIRLRGSRADADDAEVLLHEDAAQRAEVGEVEARGGQEDDHGAGALVEVRDGAAVGFEDLALGCCHGSPS